MTGKRKNYLIQGFGINDLDYPVSDCPYYLTWSGMLRRAFSEKWHKKKPSYIGTSVTDNWKFASSFKSWMETQDWEGKHLDKDILFKDNKIYGPDTCVFVTPLVNSFVTARNAARGDWPLGVTRTPYGQFTSTCQQLGGKRKFLGNFSTPEEAHQAWKEEKHKVACLLAEMQTDKRVAQALKTRYLE